MSKTTVTERKWNFPNERSWKISVYDTKLKDHFCFSHHVLGKILDQAIEKRYASIPMSAMSCTSSWKHKCQKIILEVINIMRCRWCTHATLKVKANCYLETVVLINCNIRIAEVRNLAYRTKMNNKTLFVFSFLQTQADTPALV